MGGGGDARSLVLLAEGEGARHDHGSQGRICVVGKERFRGSSEWRSENLGARFPQKK